MPPKKGTLRVIGGTARGHRLKAVPGETTRPITDIVKEALFNILGAEVVGNNILDLFGGTGAVGIEALSRGAHQVTFLDKSQKAVDTIRENLLTTHFENQAKVYRADAFTFLTNPSGQYDLIYVAPPQYRDMWQRAMRLINAQPDLLTENGQVIVQINPIEWVDTKFDNLQVFDHRRYGDTLLIFFERSAEEPHD